MTQIVILVIIGIIWIIFKIFEGISNSVSKAKNDRKVQEERNAKFGNRKINISKSLFDRNLDIIKKFSEKIEDSSYRSYYIENLTRDCINEICLAENKISIKPGSKYLRDWKNTASSEWTALASQIEKYFQEEKQKLQEEKQKLEKLMAQIVSTRIDLNKLESKRIPPNNYREILKRSGGGNIILSDIDFILKTDSITWKNKETQLIINRQLIPQPFPIFTSQISKEEINKLNDDIAEYNKNIELDIQENEFNSTFFKNIYDGFNNRVKEDVLKRIDFILNDIKFPASFPKLWDSDYDTDQSIAIVEIGLPDVVHTQIFKEVELKSGITNKTLTKKEIQEYVPKIHPAIMLRVAYEIFQNDENEVIKLLVLNGLVEYDNPATGMPTKTYTASLAVNRNQILELNLSKLDPLAAFLNLKGKSAGTLIDIIPVTPILSLDRKDKRFIVTKEVIDNLSNETNLASMDWQDFESLIAELFQKEFAEKNAEVKVTQSSRDRGVDAIIFDPDVIKGGKFVIQAKRYTKTVDVSAVRDLCAVVKKEGASRGILVTTSNYGADAYTFAQNEPITLLNGSELLGLLAKHGYKFRINIAEARKLLKEAGEIRGT